MSAYFIANIRIDNEVEYAEYLKSSGAVFEKFNGRYLAVDNSPVVLEGEWDYSRLVLIAFPDRASLYQWYNSDAYQQILQHRLRAAHCDTIAIDGLG